MPAARYKPDFSKENHLAYENSFYNCESIVDYYQELNKFLLDKNLSPSNTEDVEIFKDLLFESKFTKIHLSFIKWLIDWDTYHSRVEVIDSYAKYINQISSLHARDFWSILFDDKNISLIERLIKQASVETKVALVVAAVEYKPQIMKAIPKLKTYLIFS